MSQQAKGIGWLLRDTIARFRTIFEQEPDFYRWAARLHTPNPAIQASHVLMGLVRILRSQASRAGHRGVHTGGTGDGARREVGQDLPGRRQGGAGGER